MAQKQRRSAESFGHFSSEFTGTTPQEADRWQPWLNAVAQRFNREYNREAFELPSEVEAMPVFQEWATGGLQAKIASPFWQLAQPKKHEHWLDIGCGLSFLVYPWRDWGAFFYGQEISQTALEALNSRGPQMNSKLYRGVKRGPAHHLGYEAAKFDGVIATGVSCYYPLEYGVEMLAEIKRVLKPGGMLLLDILDVEQPLTENWAILETYLGAEVFLESQDSWKQVIQTAGGKILKTHVGEVFQLFQIQF